MRGSTLVGDKQVSNTERGSALRLSVCFFLPPPGVLLDDLKSRDRFSLDESVVAAAVLGFCPIEARRLALVFTGVSC